MIALRVIARPEGAAPGAARCVLKAEGSTIGRAVDCDLVLDDPLRTVSRRQAFVQPNGEHEALLRCISTSVDVEVNDTPVGPQVEHPLRLGDRLRIGAFELEVEADGVDATIPVQAVLPVAAATVAPAAFAAATPVPRIDRWFDLDHAPDPLGLVTPPVPPKASAQAPLKVDFDPFAPAPAADSKAGEVAAHEGARAPETDALRHAFLRGAGLADSTPLPLTPATLRHLGALLRATTEALLEQLQGRSIVKRSLRAQTTHISERQNNPLKFAPGGAEALRVLLAEEPPAGFLPPLQALDDARRDLQAHQLAMAAGLRAVLDELLARLGPDEGVGPAAPRPGWMERLPLLGDAARWRRHCKRHAELLAALDDTFESLFQRAFLAAYQAQVAQAARKAGEAPE